MKISTVSVVMVVVTVTSLMVTSCLSASVEITSRDQSFSKNLGQRLDLYCTVSGITDFQVSLGYKLSWGRYYSSSDLNEITSDGTDYVITTKNVTTSGELTSRLIVTELTYDDDGTYFCSWSVSYNGQNQPAVAYVTVEVSGRPEILQLELDRRPVAGRDVVITCLARGKPEPTITWRDPKNRLFPLSGQLFSVKTSSLSNYSVLSLLTLRNITSQLAGSYNCLVTNRLGRDDYDVELEFNEWTSITEPLEGEMNPPSEDVIEARVGVLVLQCFAYNVPKSAEIEWRFKSDSNSSRFFSLANNSSFSITSPSLIDTFSSTLNIMVSELSFEANFSSQGTYLCRTGYALHNRTVHVKGAPEVTLSPERVEVAFGDEIEIICTVTARPPTKYQYITRSGTIMSTLSEKRINSFTYEIRARLQIQSLSNLYNAIKCTGSNSYGTSSSDFMTIEDRNECVNPDLCSGDNEYCINTPGSYRCDCELGFFRDTAGYCVLEDYCTNPDLCSEDNEYCVNTAGSYRCECDVGFFRDFTGYCVCSILLNTLLASIPNFSGHAGQVLLSTANSLQLTEDNPPSTLWPSSTTLQQNGQSDKNEGGDNSKIILYASIAGGGFLLIVIIIVVVLIVFRRRGKARDAGDLRPNRERPENAKIKHGTTIYSNPAFMSNPDAPVYTALRPDRSEFPRDQLRLMEGLGQGKFGMVVRAMALSIQSSGKWDTVAVKGLKEAATDAEKNDLLRELSLLRSLPRHQNVVMFLGCCTLEDPALIIMELCEKGDLQTFLRKRRPGSTTTSHRNSSNDLTARDLFSFALHIARGMAHIAKGKIVHRDVASRNVLLTDRNVCKVSDFGLARRIDDDSEVYEIVSRRPLPIRWMSPESLRDGIHTSQSDVWSYGVLLWELVTLASSPYPGTTGKAVIDLVIGGTQPIIPPQCTGELSTIMTSCWQMTPSARPTFDDLARRFERLLEQEGDYLQLDNLEEGIYSIIEPSTSGERV